MSRDRDDRPTEGKTALLVAVGFLVGGALAVLACVVGLAALFLLLVLNGGWGR